MKTIALFLPHHVATPGRRAPAVPRIPFWKKREAVTALLVLAVPVIAVAIAALIWSSIVLADGFGSPALY
ncbi:MAG: hypothetical protein KGI69_00560 [Patescibacteria group bacterium]|nr:hypothetical protein [Patescibacteria group bacterium]